MKATKVLWAGVAAVMLMGMPCAGEPKDERGGFAEEFDSMEGWKKMDVKGEMAALKEIKSEGGVGVFVTSPAPLGSRQDAKWSDGLPMIDCFSNVLKMYGQTVDLDKYHYLVMKIDEKSCPMSFYLNGAETPIAYTTGVRAVDLKNYDNENFRGKQAVKVRMQFLNTGGTVKMDWWRLVSELSPEEKKGLIAPGYELLPEKLKGNPTQGLDAIMKRVDRPRRGDGSGTQLCFRDTATGAVIWRMTDREAASTVISDSMQSVFNANGSHMLVLNRAGGPALYDFQKRTWTPCPFGVVSRFSATDPEILWCVEQTRKPGGIKFHKLNVRTGVDEVVGEVALDLTKYPSPVTDLGFSSGTDLIAVGLRETPQCFVLDPSKPLAERVKAITLPMRLKGMVLSPDGKRLGFNRCYWYESWEMDLETGKTRLSMTGGGSHAGAGGGYRLSHYGNTILAYPEGESGGTPGDSVKILMNYRSGWETDYGHLSNNRLWYVVNGSSGDMLGKVIVASVQEPGTVFHVVHQNTSKNDWDNNSGVRSSRDCTKVAWTSDLWGYNAVCLAYTRMPEPPRDLTAAREGDAVVLKWGKPVLETDTGGHSPVELLGYNVYRVAGAGSFLPVNQQVIQGENFRDEAAPKSGDCRYVVAAVERSGVEGTASNEFVVPASDVLEKAAPVGVVHLEGELGLLTPPARIAFNGNASGWQYVRIRKELETEKVGQLSQNVNAQFSGNYRLWVRCRAEGKGGKWEAKLDNEALGEVAVEGSEWKWVACEKAMQLQGGKVRKMVLSSADIGLCVDKMILTSDATYVPAALDDRFTAAPKKLEHLEATDVDVSSVRLAWWNPKAEPDLDYFNVYVGEGSECPVDQGHLIATTRGTEAKDWGLKPGTSYTYKVVAVNRRGLMSEAAAVTAKTQALAKEALVELPIGNAKLDPRLKKESRGGVEYAWLPEQPKEKQDNPGATITWEVELPVAGEYSVWCKYAPADNYYTYMNVPFAMDDLQGGKGTWRMRTPYREMSGTSYRNYKTDLWFSDRMTMYTWPKTVDVYKLGAGKHVLTMKLMPKMGEFSHKISAVWLTNDPTWRPPGWDARANFTKAQVKRE